MSHHTNQEARNRCVKTSAAHATPADDLAANAALFARHLRAGDRSPRTIDSYLDAVRLFDAFLADRGMPRDIASIRREHIEAFVEDQLARLKPASAAVRYRSLQQFFRWPVDEGELRESPMARIKPPTVPETPPPITREDDMRRLLATTDGTSFDDRRDKAILHLLWDTGDAPVRDRRPTRRGHRRGARLLIVTGKVAVHGLRPSVRNPARP